MTFNMYKKLLTSLSALFLVVMFSQCTVNRHKNNDPIPPPPPTGRKATDQRCYRNGNLSLAERSGMYPFNKAAQVSVIAFDEALGAIPLQNGRLNPGQTKAIKVLDKKQEAALTDLIFNYNYSKNNKLKVHTEPGCYIPRNALLFTNAEGQVFAYIEICFECGNYKSSEEQVHLGTLCENKLDLLKKLFKNAGIN